MRKITSRMDSCRFIISARTPSVREVNLMITDHIKTIKNIMPIGIFNFTITPCTISNGKYIGQKDYMFDVPCYKIEAYANPKDYDGKNSLDVFSLFIKVIANLFQQPKVYAIFSIDGNEINTILTF